MGLADNNLIVKKEWEKLPIFELLDNLEAIVIRNKEIEKQLKK